jgi:hypothetical protein
MDETLEVFTEQLPSFVARARQVPGLEAYIASNTMMVHVVFFLLVSEMSVSMQQLGAAREALENLIDVAVALEFPDVVAFFRSMHECVCREIALQG